MLFPFHRSRKGHLKEEGEHFLDKIIIPAALISPIMTIPQLLQVWKGSIEGVSLATWAAYTIVSFFWVIYGLVHKEKPIIISASSLFVLEVFIVLGILLHRQ